MFYLFARFLQCQTQLKHFGGSMNFKSAILGAAFSVGTLLSAVTGANAGILDGVKILNISGIFESSLADGNMTTARNQLTGAGATITDVAIGSFSASNLTGIDILYVGLVNGGFNAGQISAIDSYIAAGGGLVAVGTERASFTGPTWEQLSNSFGLTGLGGDRNAQANPADATSPIVTGPFGTATSYEPSATGAFATPLPAGATAVWNGVDGNPIIVTLDVVGRAFFFADTNFMENGIIDQGDNAIIWGNAFAFTGQVDVPVSDVPEPLTLTLFGAGLAGLAAARRRKTKQA